MTIRKYLYGNIVLSSIFLAALLIQYKLRLISEDGILRGLIVLMGANWIVMFRVGRRFP